MTDRQTDTFLIHINMYIYTAEQVKRYATITWDMLDPRLDHSATDKVWMGYMDEREFRLSENLWFFQR